MSAARGCAGVALDGHLAEEFSPLRSTPITSAVVSEVGDPAGHLPNVDRAPLWSFPAAEQTMWDLAVCPADGALVFSINGVPALVAAPADGSIHLGRHPTAIALQLVAAVGAPALACASGAVPVHAASVEMRGRATLIVGPSGAGKSTLLGALADAGHRPISEDITVVDMTASGAAQAWPGPPWVRLAPGQAGPHGAVTRPDPTDKVNWDLTGRQTDAPTAVERIVVLEPPGEPLEAPTLSTLTTAEAIGVLPPHVAWLSTAPRAAMAFAAAVTLSRHARVVRLRLPRRPEWAQLAIDVLSGTTPR